MRSNQARAQARAHGTCRDRHRQKGERRPAWFRPLRRAHFALNSSVRLIDATLRKMTASERCAHRGPIRASRNLDEASALLVLAFARLSRAVREIVEANECIAREPERATAVPALLLQLTQRYVDTLQWLSEVADDVFTLHEHVLDGLETGELVPERPAARRPRIVLAPRPAPFRAFLLRRKPRVRERIAAFLRRRGRTPRPRAVRAPRRSELGRAPPLFSVCPL